MVYENYKIYGPYQAKDGRLRLFMTSGEERKTVSYPKYLMEKYLDRYLTEDETVDHIDGNPLNNDISNLQVKPRREHCRDDAYRNEDVTVRCAYCGKEFIISGNKLHNRNRKDNHQSGYFCSRSCTGKYGREIQLGLRESIFVDKVTPIKYQLKARSAQEETLEVEAS